MSSEEISSNKYFITPAEHLMLRDPSGCAADEIITCTFKELILNGALKIAVVKSKNIFGDADMAHSYITRGNRFDTYQHLDFQTLYLKPFRKKPIKVPTHLLSYKLLNLYKDDLTKVKSDVHKALIDKGYAEKSFLNFFGRFHLTNRGKTFASELDDLMQFAETHLAYQMTHTPLDALEIIRKLGPHITLLQNFSFKQMDEWRIKLIKALSEVTSPEQIKEKYPYPWLYYTDEENQTLDMQLIFDRETVFNLLGERFDKAIQFGLESDFGA